MWTGLGLEFGICCRHAGTERQPLPQTSTLQLELHLKIPSACRHRILRSSLPEASCQPSSWSYQNRSGYGGINIRCRGHWHRHSTPASGLGADRTLPVPVATSLAVPPGPVPTGTAAAAVTRAATVRNTGSVLLAGGGAAPAPSGPGLLGPGCSQADSESV